MSPAARAIDPDAVKRWVAEATAEVGDASRETTFLAVLQRARRAHPSLDPLAYDMDDGAVACRFPDMMPLVPPPPTRVVEMLPFVVPRAWTPASGAELAELPVMLVTPRNAFRLPLLCTVFPNAEIRVVHLTRNPAAAVNGLIDGWRRHSFFSTPVDVPLQIAGYTDRYPGWGERWWCYDLPPGWRDWTTASLPQICGFVSPRHDGGGLPAGLGLPPRTLRGPRVLARVPPGSARPAGAAAGADAEAFAGPQTRRCPS